MNPCGTKGRHWNFKKHPKAVKQIAWGLVSRCSPFEDLGLDLLLEAGQVETLSHEVKPGKENIWVNLAQTQDGWWTVEAVGALTHLYTATLRIWGSPPSAGCTVSIKRQIRLSNNPRKEGGERGVEDPTAFAAEPRKGPPDWQSVIISWDIGSLCFPFLTTKLFWSETDTDPVVTFQEPKLLQYMKCPLAVPVKCSFSVARTKFGSLKSS